MKHKALFWIIMGVSIVVGCIMAGVGIAMGGGNISYFHMQEEYDDVATTGEIAVTEADNIVNLDFDFSACDVTITEGEDFAISGSGIVSEIVDDGQTWQVKSPKRKWYQWINKWNDGEVMITLPDNQLQTVNINFGAGELEITKLSAAELTIAGGAGEASIHNLVVSDSLNLKIGAGELEIGAGDISGTSKVQCGMGELNMALTHLSGDMDVQCGLGEMDLTLPGASGDYNISRASIGSIKIDDTDGQPISIDGQPLANIDLNCGLGEIQVDFE